MARSVLTGRAIARGGFDENGSSDLAGLRPEVAALREALEQVVLLLNDTRLLDSQRESFFECLRHAILASRRHPRLLDDEDAIGHDGTRIEAAWLFLIQVRVLCPIRRRRVAECCRAVLNYPCWRQALFQSLPLRQAFAALSPEVRAELWEDAPCDFPAETPGQTPWDAPAPARLATDPWSAPAWHDANGACASAPSGGADRRWSSNSSTSARDPWGVAAQQPTQQPNPWAPAAAGASPPWGAVQQGQMPRGAPMSPWASTGDVAADGLWASPTEVASKPGQGVSGAAANPRDFEEKPRSKTRSVPDVARSAFEATREGVSSAASKTREFEQKHNVSGRVANATKSAAVATVDAGRTAAVAAREANQRHGITEKVGQGASKVATGAAGGLRKLTGGSALAAEPQGQRPFGKQDGQDTNPFRTQGLAAGVKSSEPNRLAVPNPFD